MRVISLASIKGGVGKTTAALALASDLAMEGATVAVLDADPNGHTARIGAKMVKRLPEGSLTVVGGVTEDSILSEIKKARAAVQYVFVDLPGVSSKLTLLGLARSDLVVIPVQPSEMDAHDALQTLANVRQAAEAAEREIRATFLLSRWPVTIESRAAKETRKRLATRGAGTPILTTPMMDRTALKEMSFNGAPPRLADPEGNAAGNVSAIRMELVRLLTAAKEAV